ncbi:MAG: UvrD-helicase domain-containing protein [Pseudomonadota bacterium]
MELNPQQKIAVEHLDGPLLILAGAGSGKTRVLISRIAHLMANGVQASNILAVTFTNKAAGEMRSRLERIVGNRYRDLTVGTFHSICLNILRRCSEAAGLAPNFIIYDDNDQLALVKRVLAELNLDIKKFPPRSVVEKISRAKDECHDPKKFEQLADNFYLKQISRIYNRYQEILQTSFAVDFGDLIRLVVKLFSENEDVLNAHYNRWKYLLVDEYQDTNHAQYTLLKLLSGSRKNLCVVGDDDQSIYRWRGADISNILDFEKDYPGSLVIKLEQNYRSTGNILNAANALISNNTGRKAKVLWTEKEVGERISFILAPTEKEEADEVAKKISEERTKGKLYSDMVVFYRMNAQSRPIEDAFRRFQIPYRIFGGVKFYQRKEIKDLLAYLRLVLDPHDDVSLSRIINVPPRGIGKRSLERLDLTIKDFGGSLFSSLYKLDEIGIKGKTRESLISIRTLFEELHARHFEMELSNILHEILDRSGYLDNLVSSSSLESEVRLENVNQLVSAISEFKSGKEGTGLLCEFMDQVALVSDIDRFDETAGVVSLMTLHLAKGLEFPIVYVIGLDEGTLPHASSIEDIEELEEERRLCYVGLTRAKEKVTLLSACRRQRFGVTRYGAISRFINELPDQIVHRNNLLVKNEFQMKASFNKYSQGSVVANNNRIEDDFDQRPVDERIMDFPVGCHVQHPTLGIGIIKSSEKTSVGRKVTVSFKNGHVQRLIAEFAGLVPLGSRAF